MHDKHIACTNYTSPRKIWNVTYCSTACWKIFCSLFSVSPNCLQHEKTMIMSKRDHNEEIKLYHNKIVLYSTTSKQARGERTNLPNRKNIRLFAYDQFLTHVIWHLNSGYYWISQNSTMVTIHFFINEKEVLSNSLEPGW